MRRLFWRKLRELWPLIAMNKHLVIATRGSALALWQANYIKDRIEEEFPAYTVSLNVIKTRGDAILNKPLSEVGGKGLFVKEIEEALLDGSADLAVHSAKDIPMELPEGLIIGCVPKREDPSDCFLSVNWPTINALPQGAKIGTSSLRRQAQLLAMRPDFRIEPLRGNVDTRLNKLKAGLYDGVVLATAGLFRLGLSAPYMDRLEPEKFVPAVGQGTLGIECREDNYDVLVLLSSLEDRKSRVCLSSERAFLKELNGSCQVPVAAYAKMIGEDGLSIQGLVGNLDGTEILKASSLTDASFAEETGIDLAKALKAKGADKILRQLTAD